MTVKIIYRTLIAITGSIGLYLQLSQDGPGMLLYYTVLSNLLVSLFTLYLIGRNWKQLPENCRLMRQKGLVTLAIAITFVVYHFLLSPYVQALDFWTPRNLIVHYIVPLAFMLDTLIFDPVKNYRLLDPWIWCLAPILYLIFAFFNGLVLKWPIPGSDASPFPYWFIDLNNTPSNQILTYIVVIFFGYLIGGYLLLLLKTFLGKKR